MANPRRPVVWTRMLMTGAMLLWLAALIPGVRSLRAYETTAGNMATAPGEWSSQLPSIGDPQLPTLVVALHPRCSCSRATLEELQKVAKTFKHPYNAVMLIVQPGGNNSDLQQYREAVSALHASVVTDHDGLIARQFGAFTSGEVLYYSAPDSEAKRHLLFAGGVTAGRGMVGENAGAEALKAAANREDPSVPKDPLSRFKVYGCGFSALFTAGKLTAP